MRFRVWRTVQVGTHRTIAELEKALTIKPCGRTWDSSLPFPIQPAGTLQLILVKGFQIGQMVYESRKAICNLALRAGLLECPSEVAVQLILQDSLDSYMNETNIGSTEKVGDRTDCYMSVNSRLGTSWVNCSVDAEKGFDPADVWIFVVTSSAECGLAV